MHPGACHMRAGLLPGRGGPQGGQDALQVHGQAAQVVMQALEGAESVRLQQVTHRIDCAEMMPKLGKLLVLAQHLALADGRPVPMASICEV